MNNTNFEQFINLLKQGSSKICDGELVIQLQEALNKESSYEEILRSVGYEFDKVRTIRDQKIYISFDSCNWNKQCLLFKSWKELFEKIQASELPKYFFIIDTEESSLTDTDNKLRLSLLCKIRTLLTNLADQCDPPQGIANKLSFIIETEGSIVKYQFKPEIDWCDLELISVNESQIPTAQKLTDLIAIGDSQDSERRSVMRSAFHEVISVCNHEKDIFKKIIDSIVYFHKRYEEHHDLFVKRFSINKVLHEINQQDLTYTSKINEILSNAQNKTLTVPAALIAIGAVMKIDNVLDGTVVALGMLITTIIIHRSLSVYQETFKHICKQVKSEFERYDILNEDVEIRKKAGETKKELEDLLKGANKNSTFMKRIIWVLFAIAFVFITFTTSLLINKQQVEDRDIYKELLLDSVLDLKNQLDDVKKEIRKIEKLQTNKVVDNLSQANDYTYKTIQGLNLRSGPSLNHSILSVLPIDSIVYLTNVQDNWWKIKTDKGNVGWVSSIWLKSTSK